MSSYRSAVDQLDKFEAIVRKKEAEEQKWKEYEARMEAQRQQELANLQPFPAPSWSSVSTKTSQQPVPIKFDSDDPNNDDSNDITITTEVIDHTVVDPAAPYKYVPPTQELFLGSNYGYGRNHHVTKLNEKLGHQHYQAIEAQGYSEELKDTPEALQILRKRKNPLYIVAPRGSYHINHDADVPGDYKKPRLQVYIDYICF